MPAISTRTLAAPATDSDQYGIEPSLKRIIQPLTQLEDAFAALHGRGVLPGSPALSIVSGGTVRTPTGLRLLADGVVYETTANVDIAPMLFADTVWRWARIVVTRAAGANPNDPDTYAIQHAHSSGAAPIEPAGDGWSLLASWTVDGVGVASALDNNPPGKWIAPFPWRSLNVAGSGNYTLSAAELRDGIFYLTGVLTGAKSLIFPLEAHGLFFVRNATTGAFSVTAKISGGTGGTIPQGEGRFVYVSNTDVVVVTTALLGALSRTTDDTLADGVDIGLGTGTGTQWGTAANQKQAWWGKPPIVQPAHADQAAVTLGNTDNEIGGLTISAAYDQTEVTALRDKAEELADDVRALSVLVHAMRTALVASGGMKGSA